MKDSTGESQFPIWLVADAPPKNWHKQLEAPLDPRHHSRHNIWTSLLEYMQDSLYRNAKHRFDTSKLHIRNAINNPDIKTEQKIFDWPQLQNEIEDCRSRLQSYKPKVILTFGAFAFEFMRRAQDEHPLYHFGHWGTKELGKAFRERIQSYNTSNINIIPLLHVSISRGKLL